VTDAVLGTDATGTLKGKTMGKNLQFLSDLVITRSVSMFKILWVALPVGVGPKLTPRRARESNFFLDTMIPGRGREQGSQKGVGMA
jgi:hypothetical protein